jgi:hypothetical protein
VYHVELRQFPHKSNRFNLTGPELRATILDAWARGDWVEFGERKWSPHQATLTVLEGPEIPLAQLSMGRGWRNAERECKDVTEQLIAAVRAASSGLLPAAESAAAVGAGSGLGSDLEARLGLGAHEDAAITPVRPTPDASRLADELLALLGDDPAQLLRAWRLALERHPDRAPSECLALAEDLLRG